MFKPINLGTNPRLGEDSAIPLTTNNFEVRIYDVNGNSPTEHSEVLTLYTKDIGEIAEEQDSIVVHYGNGLIKFPGKVDYANVTWNLNLFCNPNVLEALRDWRKQIYNPETEEMGLPSEYGRTVYFIKYDGRGNCKDIIKCPFTWISGLRNGEHNQEGGSVVQVGCDFVISKAIYLKPDDFGQISK